MAVRYSNVVALQKWLRRILPQQNLLGTDRAEVYQDKDLLVQMQQADVLLMLVESVQDIPLKEISMAQRLRLPIIIILPEKAEETLLAAPELAGIMCLGIPFRESVVKHALQFWPAEEAAFVKNGKHEPYCYPRLVLSKL